MNGVHIDETCNTCLSNIGKYEGETATNGRISPGPIIYEGKHWVVEHAYPCMIKGWLVIPTKRHVTALHELTHEEFEEFGGILENISKLLYQTLRTEKEYNVFFGEVPNFNHVHYHLVAKTSELPSEYHGSKIFGLLKQKENSLPKEEIASFCEQLRSKLWL